MNKVNSPIGKSFILCLLSFFIVSCGGGQPPTPEGTTTSKETVTATNTPLADQVPSTKLPPTASATNQTEPSSTPSATVTPAAAQVTTTSSQSDDSQPSPPPELTPTVPAKPPYFETTGCSKFGLGSTSYTIRCGYLTVLENRQLPAGNQIKLPVAIVQASTHDPRPDPLIYIAPAGGFNALPIVPFYAQSFGDLFLAERDLIFYNQRGAPNAIPALQCPGYERLLYQQAKLVDQTDEEKIPERVEFLRLCAGQLRSEGIELEMYSSTTNAADLADLITALELEQANTLGVSYGTNVSLALMRDQPDVIRAAILDSVYPPQVKMNSARAPNAYNILEKLFVICAADVQCNQAYPDLMNTFYALVEQLNQEPISTEVTGWLTYIDGAIFSDAIYSMLIEGRSEDVPKAIYAANDGEISALERYIPDILNAYPPGDQDFLSEGVFYSLTCREEVPFDSLDKAESEALIFPPALADHFLTLFARWQFALCDAWDIEPAGAFVDQPVASDVPTLILAGQFDPITPPEWARQSAQTLSHSYLYEFPRRGHGFFDADSCAQKLALEFLNNPGVEPSDPCFANLPAPNFR